MKAKLIEAVGATDEQKTQIDQILETHAQAIKNWQTENQDKIKAAREKFQAAQKAHQEEMKTIRESRKELQTNLKKQLGEVLSKEQMEKARKGPYAQTPHAGTARHARPTAWRYERQDARQRSRPMSNLRRRSRP